MHIFPLLSQDWIGAPQKPSVPILFPVTLKGGFFHMWPWRQKVTPSYATHQCCLDYQLARMVGNPRDFPYDGFRDGRFVWRRATPGGCRLQGAKNWPNGIWSMPNLVLQKKGPEGIQDIFCQYFFFILVFFLCSHLHLPVCVSLWPCAISMFVPDLRSVSNAVLVSAFQPLNELRLPGAHAACGRGRWCSAHLCHWPPRFECLHQSQAGIAGDSNSQIFTTHWLPLVQMRWDQCYEAICLEEDAIWHQFW